jgi:hypothetical protein
MKYLSNLNLSAARACIKSAKQELSLARDALNDDFEGESFRSIVAVLNKLITEINQTGESAYQINAKQ